MRFVTRTGLPLPSTIAAIFGVPLFLVATASFIKPELPDSARLMQFLQAAVKAPDPVFLGRLPMLLAETAGLAWIATVIAVGISFPVSFLAAKNTAPWPPLAYGLRGIATLTRAVPDLVWALIFAGLVNVGVLAGILALILVSCGFFIRTYAEALEVVSTRAVEGVEATGASRLSIHAFAVFPQAAPDILAQTLYWFDANLRSSAVLGLVGAGRLGYELTQANRLQKYDRLWVALGAVFLLVVAVDALSAWARRRLVT